MYRWLNENSKLFLERDYLLPNQSIHERVEQIAKTAENRLKINGFASKFINYMQKGWFSLSSPVWSNYGTDRGTSISCFGSYIEDSIESILYTMAEIGTMSKLGGGTSGYMGNIRGRGESIKNNGKTSGSVHFAQLPDKVTNIISQGSARRGHFAGYWDIDHKDIKEVLTIRTEGSPIQDISYGINVPDYWMNEMINGDNEKRKIWARIIQLRSEFGLPYILFTDNVNKNKPQVYKDKEFDIKASNMCTEISLPSSKDESFVCCVGSMNALYFDEWEKTDALEVFLYFYDTVIDDFIEKAQHIKFMERAVKFAKNHRSIGIGLLGWHSYLQSKMISFESMEAKMLNIKIFKNMSTKLNEATKKMAEEYGEAPVLKGYGMRHTTTMAVAPNASSSFIMQVSPSIEPITSNYFIEDRAKMKITIRNKWLENLLIKKGENTEEVWQSVLKRGGSVQHLLFLTENEKNVFKTFSEISQKEVIIQGAARQKYIDQSQSLNLTIHPDTPTKDINELMIFAWKQGIKTLYYQHSVNASQEFSRNILSCQSCEA